MTETTTIWVRTWLDGGDWIEHLDGRPWGHAGPPRRLHRCRPQTRGWIRMDYVERCNCGATRLHPLGPWMEKNQTRISRRKARERERAPKVMVTCGRCSEAYEAAAGSQQEWERLCSTCWADSFIAAYRGGNLS